MGGLGDSHVFYLKFYIQSLILIRKLKTHKKIASRGVSFRDD